MKSMRLFAVVLTLLLLSVACQTAKPPEAPAAAPTVTEIQPRADAYAAALEAGNAEAIAAMFTDDGILMPSEAPALTGRAAVQGYYMKSFERGSQKGSIKVEETGGLGDLAFARGTATFVVTPRGGDKPLPLTLKWMNISKRQADGSWKIHRSISNLDHPNPMPAR